MCVLPALAWAQEYLKAWTDVSEDQSGLVLLIDADMKGSAIFLRGPKGENLSETKWESDLPLLKQFRLPPRTYKIHLPGPVQSITLNTKAGALTFLKIEPYKPPGTAEPGIQLSSLSGRPSVEIEKILTGLFEVNDENVTPMPIKAEGGELYLSTEPPWPPPPPPKQ